MTLVVDAVAQPFSQPVAPRSRHRRRPPRRASPRRCRSRWRRSGWAAALLILLIWCVRWRRVDAAVRRATDDHDGRALAALRRLEQRGGITRPVALVSSDSPFEPGVFGILSPVLLWPRRIAERLDDDQVEAILAHELAHVRRRDNLAAALHMVVQALFWFHPLVWWVGARLVDERERACDEEVHPAGQRAAGVRREHPQDLRVLRRVAAGVRGRRDRLGSQAADRGDHEPRRGPRAQRLEKDPPGRCRGRRGRRAGGRRRAEPRLCGSRRRRQPPTDPTFEVASVKPNKSGEGFVQLGGRGGQFTITNAPLRLIIRNAYRLQDFQIVGGPGWLNSDRFDIVAKSDPTATPDQTQAMIKALLAERFKLKVHTESRELPLYALQLARSDGKLGPKIKTAAVDCAALAAARRGSPSPPGAGGPGGPGGPGLITRGGPGGPGGAGAPPAPGGGPGGARGPDSPFGPCGCGSGPAALPPMGSRCPSWRPACRSGSIAPWWTGPVSPAASTWSSRGRRNSCRRAAASRRPERPAATDRSQRSVDLHRRAGTARVEARGAARAGRGPGHRQRRAADGGLEESGIRNWECRSVPLEPGCSRREHAGIAA